MASDTENHRSSLPTAGTMAPPQLKDTKKLDISSLMSPPDAVLDSFNNNSALRSSYTVANMMGPAPRSTMNEANGKHPLPMSPPISPHSKAIVTAESPSTKLTSPGEAIKDPVLFDENHSHTTGSPAQSPLFAPTDSYEHQRLVDQHLRHRSPTIFTSGVTPPKREDYELVLNFRSQVMRHFTANRKGWLRQERAFLKATAALGPKRYQTLMPAKPIAAKPGRGHRVDRVTKPANGAPRAPRAGVVKVSGRGRATATPEPSRRIVAPNREDKDFASLPDYCPPLDTLPNKPNSLKVDWKGSPIDLSGDSHAHLLHEDELLLAGNLRLDCATYLTSKRRMFVRRMECLKVGKEFRKTDAQQACKIDVNKASKLWTAFDRVGWLNEKYMRRFL